MKYVWKETKSGKSEGFLEFDSGKSILLSAKEYMELRIWMNRKDIRSELMTYDMLNSLRVAFV